MDDLTYEVRRIRLKLETSFKYLEPKTLVVKNKSEETFEHILNEIRKSSLENDCKSSSGNDDELSSSEDEPICSGNVLNKHKSEEHDEIDEDYYETFESCCSLDGDFYIPADEIKISQLKVVTPLPLFLPSEKIKIANDLKFSLTSLLENHDDIIKKYLKDSKLTENNIHIVYKMLLEMEDITCMTEYVPFVQKNVILNCTGMAREYWIRIKDCPNIEDIITPLIDEVVLVPKGSSLIWETVKYKTDILLPHKDEESRFDLFRRRIAIVRNITKDRVHFRFSKADHLSAVQIASLSTTKYDVIFRSQRYPLRYQHNAIELLAYNEEMRKYLFPTENSLKNLLFYPQFDLVLFNKTIASNPEQLRAVKNITQGPNVNAPFVIFGPPGTGKTTIIVESILQLHFHKPANRILVTAGSNSACDTIALRICKYFKEKDDPINQKSMIRLYSKSVVEKGIKSIDAELLKYSNCEKGHHYYPPIEEISQYGIIVATLCTVGKLVTCDVGKMHFFTHIFLDEAGASTIPESLVAVMGIKSHKSCRLILSGDHKQLGPILRSDRAAELGLEQSLMEHFLNFDCYAIDDNCNYNHTLQARLRRNFRSHPEIVRLYNHLFYKNELIAESKEEHVNLAAKWCKLPNPKFPIMFQAVHGVTEKDKESPSSFNNLEIDVVMWFLRRLLNDGIDGQRVNQKDIGIITPYKLQSKRIQSRLNDRGWKNVETGSVETFQGREKQIIIVSLVRSFAGLGFVSEPKRLNVLLSRPKSLLILIGNPLTLRRNSNFAFILDECKRHGTFLRKDKTKKK